MTLKQILLQHPAPWRYQTASGQVIMLDAAGRQVQLFTMLDFVTLATAAMARNAAPSSAPYNESVTTESPKEA